MMENLKKAAGFYDLDHASINDLNTKATVPASASGSSTSSNGKKKQEELKPGEAQLWQINAFLQSEKKRQPGTELVLYAKRVSYERADERKIEKIRFYSRPKAEKGLLAFLDNLIHQDERKLAVGILADVANAYKASAGKLTASYPELAPSLHSLTQPSASADTGSMERHLWTVAGAIEKEKLEGALAQQSGFRNAVREELKILFTGSDIPVIDSQKALNDFQPFAFHPRKVAIFQRFVDGIISARSKGEKGLSAEDLSAINDFQRMWVKLSESDSPEGQRLRDLVWDNPAYHAFGVVAYRLAKRPAPTFDFDAHHKGDVVMVPEIEHVQALSGTANTKIVRRTIRELHAAASKTGSAQFTELTISRKQVLVAAKNCVISPEQTGVSHSQFQYLKRTYESVFAHKAGSARTVILTPLFNYTKNTIDECISIMLQPLKTAREKGMKLPLVGVFSVDPRIRSKFQDALLEWKVELKNRKSTDEGALQNDGARSYSTTKPLPIETANALTAEEKKSMAGSVTEVIARDLDTPQQDLEMISKSSWATGMGEFIAQGAEKIMENFHNLEMSRNEGKAGTAPAVIEELQKGSILHFPAPGGSDLPTAIPTSDPGVLSAASKVAHDMKLAPESHHDHGEYKSARLKLESPGKAGKSRTDAGSSEVTPATKKKKGKKAKRAPREAAIIEVTLPAGQGIGIGKARLQCGIMEDDWLPPEDTVILLTKSAAQYVQPAQAVLRREIDSLLEEEGFSTFADTGMAYRPNGLSVGKHSNRYIAPVTQLSITTRLFQTDLTKIQADSIIATYQTCIAHSRQLCIRNLVLMPCFSMPSNTVLGNQKPYEKAIAIMLATLDSLSLDSPELQLTLVARSEDEKALMQQEIEALARQKREQKSAV